MKTLIDETYVGIRRLDFKQKESKLEKIVFLAQEIESSQLRVVKLFLPHE